MLPSQTGSIPVPPLHSAFRSHDLTTSPDITAAPSSHTVTAREPYDTPVIITAPFVMFPSSGHLITETVQYC